MRWRRWIVLAALLLVAAALALPRLSRWLEVDACLDGGGCWNEEAGLCELDDGARCGRRGG